MSEKEKPKEYKPCIYCGNKEQPRRHQDCPGCGAQRFEKQSAPGTHIDDDLAQAIKVTQESMAGFVQAVRPVVGYTTGISEMWQTSTGVAEACSDEPKKI